MDVEDEAFKIDFDVAKSIRYHAYRRSFWDTVDNISKIFIIISGSAVLVSVVGKWQQVSLAMSFAVAFFSASDVVLGFSQRARKYDSLYRAFSRLAQDISEASKFDEEKIRGWQRRRLEIEMDEPFVMDLLERRCSGEEAKARGCELRAAWKLTRWQTFISQIAILPATHQSEAPESC